LGHDYGLSYVFRVDGSCILNPTYAQLGTRNYHISAEERFMNRNAYIQ